MVSYPARPRLSMGGADSWPEDCISQASLWAGATMWHSAGQWGGSRSDLYNFLAVPGKGKCRCLAPSCCNTVTLAPNCVCTCCWVTRDKNTVASVCPKKTSLVHPSLGIFMGLNRETTGVTVWMDQSLSGRRILCLQASPHPCPPYLPSCLPLWQHGHLLVPWYQGPHEQAQLLCDTVPPWLLKRKKKHVGISCTWGN